MKLPPVISGILGNLRFKREVQNLKHKHEVVGFDTAKKIGVLYDATDSNNFEVIKAYVKKIRSQHKDILALGYVDRKELPANQYAQYGLDFFTRSHLNWQMIPDYVIVNNFIAEKFDILINLTSSKCFPLRYIAAVSCARFRVGRFDRRNMMCYEMMIDTKGEPGIKIVIEQVEEYLRKIKNT